MYMKRCVVLLFLVCVILAQFGCAKKPVPMTAEQENRNALNLRVSQSVKVVWTIDGIITAKDFGNGVIFFQCTSDYFGYALSVFLAAKPELEVSAISGETTWQNRHYNKNITDSDYGVTTGYFVTFREKK